MAKRYDVLARLKTPTIGLVVCLLCAGIAVAQNPAPAPAPASPAQSQPETNTLPPAQDGAPLPSAEPTNPGAGDAPDAGAFVFKTRATEVVLHVTVLDGENHPVMGLDKLAFAVAENGKPQRITSFKPEDVPVALGIVIDNSGSMRTLRPSLNRAAINLVKASSPRDGVFVVNFGENYYLDQDFTSDIPKLEQALSKIDTRGSTAIYDALVASANHLDKNASTDKKIILLITDGSDNASQESLQEAIKRLQEKNGPVIYTIALLQAGSKDQEKTRRTLEAISRETGGAAFFPTNIDEVDAISRNIAHDIRSQYTLNYRPSIKPRTGEYHAIQVIAKSGKVQYQVRTRSGYYGGQENEPPSQIPVDRSSSSSPTGQN